MLGGLGINNMCPLNQTFMLKLGWSLLYNPNPLWATIMKHKYYPKTPFLYSKTKLKNSWVWKSVSKGISLLKDVLQWSLHEGHVKF